MAMAPARRKSPLPEQTRARAEDQRELNGVVSAGVAEAPDSGLPKERLLRMYEMILLARAVDERQWVLNRQGKQPFHISCQGHEGSGVGSAFALDPSRDVMVPYYRSLGAVMAFGMTAREIMLAALAKA
ncbi:MAG: thiamine pyrophosphate-dependent enzyme, partial [Chloroflexota bacterium]|nr:thiamine pyrophosphate-dependent enzyme [Chloroflexota bacterium]